jgi:hypothetical protein
VSGDSLTLTATLKDVNGNPLTGKTITWSETQGRGTLDPTSGTTDENGRMTVTYTAPTVTQIENVTIKASFAGDGDYEASENTSTGTITPIPRTPTSLGIEPPSFFIESEESILLTATLTDNAGNPLVEKTISWNAIAGNVNPSNSTTDNQGRASTTYTAPVVDVRTSDTIEASFAGDAEYLASNTTSVATVLPTEVVEELENLKENLREQTSEIGVQLENEQLEVLENAFLREDLGAIVVITIVVDKPGLTKGYEHENIQIELENVVIEERIDIAVTSGVENGKTIVINVDDRVLPVGLIQRILVDNEEIGRADNYADVLDPTDENVPEYFIREGDRGAHILVSIPSFSTRIITIMTRRVEPVTEIPLHLIIGASVLVLAVVAGFLWVRVRKPKPLVKPPPEKPPEVPPEKPPVRRIKFKVFRPPEKPPPEKPPEVPPEKPPEEKPPARRVKFRVLRPPEKPPPEKPPEVPPEKPPEKLRVKIVEEPEEKPKPEGEPAAEEKEPEKTPEEKPPTRRLKFKVRKQ